MLINRSVNFFAAGRALHVIVATALLTASLAARAADDARMDACIEAFVAASLPKDQPIRVLKSGPSPRALGAPSRGYQIVLTATGTSTGKRFARATCTVGRDGAVMAMNGKLIRIRTADGSSALPRKRRRAETAYIHFGRREWPASPCRALHGPLPK